MDYAQLLIDAGEYAGRDDFAHLFQNFVRRAENKINRTLRIADMEKAATLTTVDGKAQLPADFLEARSFVNNADRELPSKSIQYLNGFYGTRSGVAKAYAIVGNELTVFPWADGPFRLVYYAKIPPLTPQTPVNWLLTKEEDAYLYGVVEEIAVWEANPDKASAAAGLKNAALGRLSLQDERARWGNAALSIGSPTP